MSKPNKYDQGQHALICKALHVSPNYNEPGCTAYEAVCVLLMKLQVAEATLSRLKITTKQRRSALNYLRAKPDSDTFSLIELAGTETE